MNPTATPQPDTPTIILVGGTFSADTGEQLDSRQPFADDPRGRVAQAALAQSEIWWGATTSLVLPLLDAKGAHNFAMICGIRAVVALRPDGTILRRRLASVLPGGVRTAEKSVGRWQLLNMRSDLWGPRDFRGRLTTPFIVTTDGWLCDRHDYADFEHTWRLKSEDDLIIVTPHTNATSVYLDGYVEWVADGRPKYAPIPPLSSYGYDGTPLAEVVPVEGDFRVTGVLQKGKWIDPAPLEAARLLLQARFDLKLGIWDLVQNHVLRATLLKETPVAAPPSTPAAKTAGAIERQQALQARRTEKQKRSAASRAESATLVSVLDASGWTTSLPGVLGDIDPTHPFRRSLPIAVVPDCDDAEARGRHPAMRPGKTILWLQFELRRGRPSDSEVVLVVPPPLSELRRRIFDPFFKEHSSSLERIASPNHVSGGVTLHSRDTISFNVLAYEYTGGKTDWAERLAGIAQRTPAWVELFAPLARAVQEVITANPRLGCT
jgi:hypothetical protein